MGHAMTSIEMLSLGGFTLSLVGFTAALEEHSPRLDKTRWWCLALTGSVLSIGLVGHVATWAIVVSCLGFLISMVAVALASYAERETAEREPAERETAEREPAWWPEFERDFARYIRQASERDTTR
jgi:hypothetical protein